MNLRSWTRRQPCGNLVVMTSPAASPADASARALPTSAAAGPAVASALATRVASARWSCRCASASLQRYLSWFRERLRTAEPRHVAGSARCARCRWIDATMRCSRRYYGVRVRAARSTRQEMQPVRCAIGHLCSRRTTRRRRWCWTRGLRTLEVNAWHASPGAVARPAAVDPRRTAEHARGHAAPADLARSVNRDAIRHDVWQRAAARGAACVTGTRQASRRCAAAARRRLRRSPRRSCIRAAACAPARAAASWRSSDLHDPSAPLDVTVGPLRVEHLFLRTRRRAMRLPRPATTGKTEDWNVEFDAGPGDAGLRRSAHSSSRGAQQHLYRDAAHPPAQYRATRIARAWRPDPEQGGDRCGCSARRRFASWKPICSPSRTSLMRPRCGPAATASIASAGMPRQMVPVVIIPCPRGRPSTTTPRQRNRIRRRPDRDRIRPVFDFSGPWPSFDGRHATCHPAPRITYQPGCRCRGPAGMVSRLAVLAVDVNDAGSSMTGLRRRAASNSPQ